MMIEFFTVNDPIAFSLHLSLSPSVSVRIRRFALSLPFVCMSLNCSWCEIFASRSCRWTQRMIFTMKFILQFAMSTSNSGVNLVTSSTTTLWFDSQIISNDITVIIISTSTSTHLPVVLHGNHTPTHTRHTRISWALLQLRRKSNYTEKWFKFLVRETALCECLWFSLCSCVCYYFYFFISHPFNA